MLDPKLKGKVAVFDPAQSSIIPGCYDAQVKAAGPTFLQDLAKQSPKIYPGSAAQEAAVGSGEVAVTAFGTKNLLNNKKNGAPVDFKVPPSGACVTTGEGAILKDSPHPNAAQVFASFVMSLQGQTIYNDATTPGRSNVPGSNVNFKDLPAATQPASSQDQQAFVAKFNGLFRS
jgi:iron(III) transport system substrate-binding protein